VFLTSALSCQGLVNKDLSQKISIINSLKWSTSTRFYAFSTWGSGIVQSACIIFQCSWTHDSDLFAFWFENCRITTLCWHVLSLSHNTGTVVALWIVIKLKMSLQIGNGDGMGYLMWICCWGWDLTYLDWHGMTKRRVQVVDYFVPYFISWRSPSWTLPSSACFNVIVFDPVWSSIYRYHFLLPAVPYLQYGWYLVTQVWKYHFSFLTWVYRRLWVSIIWICEWIGILYTLLMLITIVWHTSHIEKK